MTNSNSVENQINNYLKKMSDKKKKALLNLVKTFAEESLTLWDVMPEEVRKGVEKSLEESKKDNGKTHEEIMKKYYQWLEK